MADMPYHGNTYADSTYYNKRAHPVCTPIYGAFYDVRSLNALFASLLAIGFGGCTVVSSPDSFEGKTVWKIE